MGTIASQITSLTIVYPNVYSEADQRKHQSSASLAFVWGIHRGPVNSLHKWPVTLKMVPFDHVIMYSPVLDLWGTFTGYQASRKTASFKQGRGIHSYKSPSSNKLMYYGSLWGSKFTNDIWLLKYWVNALDHYAMISRVRCWISNLVMAMSYMIRVPHRNGFYDSRKAVFHLPCILLKYLPSMAFVTHLTGFACIFPKCSKVF